MNVSQSEQLEFLVAQFEEKRARYPIWQCDAAQFVLFKTLGLRPINGIYVPETDIHSWNYDPIQDIYIDITLHQFEGQRNKISILPTQTPLLKQNKRPTFLQNRREYQLLHSENGDIIKAFNRAYRTHAR
jgi:hypothetical protein